MSPKPQAVAVASHPPNNDTYSQAVRLGDLIFVSGQLGMDPATRALVPGGIQAQTRQALENVSAVLQAAGSSLEMVARCNIFITNFSWLPAMNEVYAQYFRSHKPAKTTVEISRLDRGAAIEIEVVAGYRRSSARARSAMSKNSRSRAASGKRMPAARK